MREACVVTGVAGFVGSHLAERLLARGYEVVGVDNFFSGYSHNMAGFRNHPAFTFHERSITEASLLASLKEKHPALACCFHLAAVVSVPYSVDHAEETMEVNWISTARLLEEAAQSGFQAFLFAGSAAEYGEEGRLPVREEYATDLTVHPSPYGRSKYLSSQKVGSSPIGVALRCFNIYGPRQDPRSPYSGVISRFVALAFARQPLTVFGDGQQTRDFIYVGDVVSAYVRAAGLDGTGVRVPHGIYNIGTGERTSILRLAEVINELAGNREPTQFLPERPGDIRHSVAAVETFRRASGWSPEVGLRDGLRLTLDWARSG
ncbi:MAG: NAD-dependent epimerase/dehydratase family protein [Syntrophobacteraceae bacterium]